MGRVRSHHPAAPGDPKNPPHPFLLSIYLDDLESRGTTVIASKKATRSVSGLLRPHIAALSDLGLGRRLGDELRHDAIRRRFGDQPDRLHAGIYTDLYLSGTTFFTLGLGDVVPRSTFARFLVVAESGFGFGFLAAIIGYLPFIYGAFGARETNITLLDARAGTPPTAGELLRRHSFPDGEEALEKLLEDWERWSAELLESHLSYPVLAYFRSQHDNQSWIASLTAILDTCALSIAGIEGACAKQAELTFAISRHAVVDLAQVFSASPHALPHDRLPPEDLLRLRTTLADARHEAVANAASGQEADRIAPDV